MARTGPVHGLKHTPYWWDAAPREPPSPEALPAKADAVVIGGGYAGLSAALELARSGRDVLVLDAEAPGWGASSRSGGMIGHGHRVPYSKLIERHGPDKAKALIREGMAALEHLVALVGRENIDAGLQRVGRFRGAANAGDFEPMVREGEKLQRDLGLAVEVVPRAEQRREIATDAYHGGLLFPSHGGVHPAKLHRGLLAAARRAGAAVRGHVRVDGVGRDGAGFTVRTGRGTVAARDVLVATNGYTGRATPALARRVVGLPSFLIATEPLGENRVRSIFPTGRMIVETGATHVYFRPSPDGTRLVFGGRAALHPIPLPEAAGRLKDMMRALLPDLGDVALSHAWTGNVAMTRTDLPGIGRRDGLWYAIGCNGSGVALMNHLGHKAALKILGRPEGATAFDDLEPPPVPFFDGRGWFLPALTWWWRAKDALRRAG